jgi:hypothetical protein
LVGQLLSKESAIPLSASSPQVSGLDGEEADVFTPLGQNTAGYLRNRRPHPVGVVARLQRGVTLVQAQKELALIGGHLSEQYPDTNAGRAFEVQPLRPEIGDVRSTLWLLLVAVRLMLLIACTNVADFNLGLLSPSTLQALYRAFSAPLPFLFQYFRTTIFLERPASSRYVSTIGLVVVLGLHSSRMESTIISGKMVYPWRPSTIR